VTEHIHRCVGIFGSHLKLDAAEQIGNEPVHADHVVVDQNGFNTRRVECALGEQRVGQISELPDCNQTIALHWSDQWAMFASRGGWTFVKAWSGGVVRRRQPAAAHLRD
jgi:hypothetical protein